MLSEQTSISAQVANLLGCHVYGQEQILMRDIQWVCLCYVLGYNCLIKGVSRAQKIKVSSVHLSHSVVSDSLNHSTPGLPVHHQLPESTQTHVHRVGDAIQPSHPLLSPSPPALSLSQHQGLFK